MGQVRAFLDAAQRREREAMKSRMREQAIATALGFAGSEGLEILERSLR